MLESLTATRFLAHDDIPGVTLLGVVMGVLLVIAAIRAMFGKRKR